MSSTSSSTSPDRTAEPARRLVVAFLGTGVMGAPMARNIAAAGHDVRVWNRTRSKAEALADVATVADEPAGAVSGADVVVTMLHDADAVLDAIARTRGSWGEETVWLQQSTVGVEGSQQIAAMATDLGVDLVDAPVLGTRQPAEQGALVVLASGEESLRPRVDPVLEAVGQRTMWVGDAGAGSRLKLAANAWVLSVVQGVSDSLTLTRELGLDPALFLQAVAGGALDAPYVQVKGSAMLEGSVEASFALSGGVKDAALILAAARGAGVDLALMPGVEAALRRAVEAGHGDEDLAATYLA